MEATPDGASVVVNTHVHGHSTCEEKVHTSHREATECRKVWTGMKITAGHWPKSVHIGRLAIHCTLWSVIMAEREMRMHLQ